jgi:hypothetical protein
MPSPKEKAPAYEEVIADLLRSKTGPVSAKELAEKMLAARPSPARNPLRAMRQHLRHADGRVLVFLDADTILPLHLAFRGVRFRLPLDRDAVNKGLVNIGDSLPSHLPSHFTLERARFVDTAGMPIAFQLKPVSQQVDTSFGRKGITTVYARLPDKSGYPPSHWMIVLEEDGRMTNDGWRIHYSDSDFSPPERLARELAGEPRHLAARPIPGGQGQQLYRFNAALAYRPKIWRTIELQGRHSLADLDLALRRAFNHDVFDHLGGFWKLVPRGAQAKPGAAKRKATRQPRYREVELGDVEPMGGGEGADLRIAALELAVGDRLKYVYDFGDWIEHLLTLEAVEIPQADVKYPREIARNQPEYMYCVECQKKGRQKVAQWICPECTTGPENEIVLCEKCAGKHVKHYLEETLY